MVFTPGWTKKPGRAIQLRRTVAERRDIARPVLCAGPHANAVFSITHPREEKLSLPS